MADQTKFFPVESSSARKSSSRKLHSLTPESKFWRSFKNANLASNLILPITSFDFSPKPPFDLAAASSAAIHLFSGDSLLPKSHSPLTSFKDLAFSPSFRCDGDLLAAGGQSGVIQIFNPLAAGNSLRQLRSHSRPVHCVRFPRVADKLHLFSAGDDALLSYWDVATESQVVSFPSAHRDYIRACSASPICADVIATGSYDHSVGVWDVRVSPGLSKVCSFTHGSPVESLIFLPSGGLVATAGGNEVKIWDVIGGGRLVHTMESHNKTVTSLCVGRVGEKFGGESRIFSVSIDGYLKIFDFASFRVTHTVRYPAQLLSVGFSPSGLCRVVGTSNGVIYAGKKKVKDDVGVEVGGEIERFLPEAEKKVLRPTNYRYFRRGQSEKPSESDHVVKKLKKVKLAEHDMLLKKFRHKDALLAALKSMRPSSIVAVMEELVARKKLVNCIANLDANGLAMLFKFLHRNATKVRYARFLMGLAKKVLEMCSKEVQCSVELSRHVQNLKCMIEEELRIQRSLKEIQGMLSPLLVIAGR